MLFDEEPQLKRKGVRLRALPSIPETGWRPPTSFPNLSSAKAISIDTETFDPELNKAGPGWGRQRFGHKKGHIVGVSLAAVDYLGNKGKWYFPVRHEVETHLNLDPANVFPWLKYALSNPYQWKVGANLPYDLGWLEEEGIPVAGQIHDVQFAEALIDNNAFSVGLETLGKKYLGRGKTTDVLKDWVMEAYKPKKSEWRGEIYRSPPSLVGYYAEDDADMPLDLIHIMGPILEAEELYGVYRMECDMMPMMRAMRRAGVYVNVEKAERLKLELEGNIEELREKIWREYGFSLEATDSPQIAKLLDHLGIEYPRNAPTNRTPDGSPSLKKEWLDVLDHPIGEIINNIREMEKMNGTFIQSYIIDKNVNGWLHPQFHPLRGEESGTMLGRFSSTDPNLQNIPGRTKLGKRVRDCFEPDPGHYRWRKHDYSQVHYRILAHFAVDRGDGSADKLRQSYNDNPDMDYHFNMYQTVAPTMTNLNGSPWSIDYTQTPDEDGVLQYNEEIQGHRRIIKNINFSGIYGVGEETVGFKYLKGLSKAQVKAFLKAFHEGAPFIKATTEDIAKEAERYGFVRTLLGRRVRFNMWEPMAFKHDKEQVPLPYDLAIKKWGSFIRLAYLYRAVNYKFQGSEPDIMKTGMLNLWNSGVFDYIGVPRVTVHDELGWSQIDDSPQTEEAFRYVQDVQQKAIQLRVPVKCDMGKGTSWGKAK